MIVSLMVGVLVGTYFPFFVVSPIIHTKNKSREKEIIFLIMLKPRSKAGFFIFVFQLNYNDTIFIIY